LAVSTGASLARTFNFSVSKRPLTFTGAMQKSKK
jgi:hypothetical protein